MSQKRNGRILITGASGMLGKDLTQTIRVDRIDSRSRVGNRTIQVIATDLPDLDITWSGATDEILSLTPTLIIHLAAYANVDGCERDPQRAWKVNSLGTRNVALACHRLGIPMLYVSTDYVFDGRKPTPYVEWDLTNPLSIYGQSKLDGELWMKRLLKRYWIVRSSGLYGKEGNNFVTAILNKARQSNEIRVVDDQLCAPTYTRDLAGAIARLIHTEDFGTYHVTNSGWTSWFEFARAIVETCSDPHLHCNVLPMSSDELDRPAPRPRNSRLLNFVWERVLGKPLRPWKEALDEYLGSDRAKH